MTKVLSVQISVNKIVLALLCLETETVIHKEDFWTWGVFIKEKLEEKIRTHLNKLQAVESWNNIKNVVIVSSLSKLNEMFVAFLEKITSKKVVVLPFKRQVKNKINNWNSEVAMLLKGTNKNYTDFVIINFEETTSVVTVNKNVLKELVTLPGLALSKRILVENAALIKDFKDYHFKDVLTTGTEKAVSAGLILNQLAIVENAAQKLMNKTPILITGSELKHLKKHLNLNFLYHFEPELLLTGVIKNYKELFNQRKNI